MSYRSITTFLHNPAASQNALEYAISSAREWDAHLHIVNAGIDSTDPGFYYAGAQAIAVQQNLEQAQLDANQIEEVVRARLAREDILWDMRTVTMMANSVGPFLSEHMRFYDLAIMPLPYGHMRNVVDISVFEACMFGAGVPVLVVPDAATWLYPPQRLLIAWDESSEALAAARASIPFGEMSKLTEICMIAPPREGENRSDPGGRLAQVLARSRIPVEITVQARSAQTIADQLLSRATDTQTDMIVMGAYGHSRLRVAVMGGVTRSMLRHATIPVLMAH